MSVIGLLHNVWTLVSIGCSIVSLFALYSYIHLSISYFYFSLTPSLPIILTFFLSLPHFLPCLSLSLCLFMCLSVFLSVCLLHIFDKYLQIFYTFLLSFLVPSLLLFYNFIRSCHYSLLWWLFLLLQSSCSLSSFVRVKKCSI